MMYCMVYINNMNNQSIYSIVYRIREAGMDNIGQNSIEQEYLTITLTKGGQDDYNN